VPDGVLFDDLAARTGDAPTFTLVLTTSYHPPYSLDVERLGVAIDAVPAALSGVYDGRVPLREFAHLRYADRELGRFVAQVERAHPDSLFAITGDHWSRRFLNQHPSLYESRAVPLVLYGPLTLGGAAGERRTPGSHLDIAPTLVNLVAESGFTYHTFGHDLLSPAAPPFALGADVLFTAEEVVLFPAGADAEQARFGRAWLGVAWWRLLRGSAIDY
ncbi:MAG: sulfatase-like hydrolase/transferase, partial [Verrucomicrobiales bacterium]|jgi:phosphoglycerol transferase MdoB-like AlkP superfamily enzyme|nr:sulfatase-like hydrolase/transferase [Verrucomicrobiales bacterium]